MIVISSLSMVLAAGPAAHGFNKSTNLQGAAIAPAQSAAELHARWKDERNGKLVMGALWAAMPSDDVDQKDGEVLEQVHPYVAAISNGDRAALEAGAVTAFKERMSRLLEDDSQGMRALAAALLGVFGDKSYARPIAIDLELPLDSGHCEQESTRTLSRNY